MNRLADSSINGLYGVLYRGFLRDDWTLYKTRSLIVYTWRWFKDRSLYGPSKLSLEYPWSAFILRYNTQRGKTWKKSELRARVQSAARSA